VRHHILLAAVLLVVACGADDPSVRPTIKPGTATPSSSLQTASRPAPITADAIAGREFWSTSITGRDLVPGTRVGLRFEAGGRLHGGAGCNLMDGTWSLLCATLDARYAATTEMGCPEARHDQDAWIGEFISSDPTATITGDELVLAVDDLAMTLLDREVADPDRSLAETRWTLTAMTRGDAPVDIVSSVPDGAHGSILIEGDRPMIRIDTGCNTGQASVTLDGTTMTIGPLALTRRGCSGDGTEVERKMTAVLQGVVSFEIDGRALDVTGAGGGRYFAAE
jgi:heat shock protein HslJ